MLLITPSARQRLTRGLGTASPAAAPLTSTAAPTASATESAAASQSSEASIIASACGSSPNYCTLKSGANKDGYLQAFLEEAASTRLVPYPATSNNALMVMEDDARTNCTNEAATGAGGSSGANVGQAVGGATKLAVGVATPIVGAAVGAAAGSIVPIVGTIIGAIAGIVSGLFSASHAKAVAGEQSDICGATPQINAALQQIDAGLAGGTITPAQAQASYSSLQTAYRTALGQNTTYKTGDALWAYDLALTVVIQMRNHDIANGLLTGGGVAPWATPAQQAAAGGVGSSIADSLGISSDLMPYLVIGGAALAAFLL